MGIDRAAAMGIDRVAAMGIDRVAAMGIDRVAVGRRLRALVAGPTPGRRDNVVARSAGAAAALLADIVAYGATCQDPWAVHEEAELLADALETVAAAFAADGDPYGGDARGAGRTLSAQTHLLRGIAADAAGQRQRAHRYFTLAAHPATARLDGVAHALATIGAALTDEAAHRTRATVPRTPRRNEVAPRTPATEEAADPAAPAAVPPPAQDVLAPLEDLCGRALPGLRAAVTVRCAAYAAVRAATKGRGGRREALARWLERWGSGAEVELWIAWNHPLHSGPEAHVRDDEALPAWAALGDQVLAAYPQAAGFRRTLARRLRAEGATAREIHVLTTLLADDPGDEQAVTALAHAYAVAGRPDEGVALLRSRVTAPPVPADAPLVESLALLLAHRGHPEARKWDEELARISGRRAHALPRTTDDVRAYAAPPSGYARFQGGPRTGVCMQGGGRFDELDEHGPGAAGVRREGGEPSQRGERVGPGHRGEPGEPSQPDEPGTLRRSGGLGEHGQPTGSGEPQRPGESCEPSQPVHRDEPIGTAERAAELCEVGAWDAGDGCGERGKACEPGQPATPSDTDAHIRAALIAGSPDRRRELLRLAEDDPRCAAKAAKLLGVPLVTRAGREAADLIARGEGHFHRGEYADAAGCYRQALEADPDSSLALFMLGDVHFVRRETGLARVHFQESLAVEETPLAWRFLGDTFRETPDGTEEARRCYERALALDPGHGGARHSLAALPPRTEAPTAPPAPTARPAPTAPPAPAESGAAPEPPTPSPAPASDSTPAPAANPQPQALQPADREAALRERGPALRALFDAVGDDARFDAWLRRQGAHHWAEAADALREMVVHRGTGAKDVERSLLLARRGVQLAEHLDTQWPTGDPAGAGRARLLADALHRAADVLEAMGRHSEAYDLLRQAERWTEADEHERERAGREPWAGSGHVGPLDSWAALYAALGRLARRCDDAAAAEDYQHRLDELTADTLSADPGRALALVELGLAWQRLGEWERALSWFHKALALAGREAPRPPVRVALAAAHHHVGVALGELGLPRTALRHLAEARRHACGDADRLARNWLATASVLRRRPDLGHAVPAYERVLRLAGVPGGAGGPRPRAPHGEPPATIAPGRAWPAILPMAHAAWEYGEQDTAADILERGAETAALVRAAEPDPQRRLRLDDDVATAYALLTRFHLRRAEGAVRGEDARHHVTAAFAASERLRARPLLDAMSGARLRTPDGVPPALLRHEAELLRERTALTAAPVVDRRRLHDLTARLDTVWREIAGYGPRAEEYGAVRRATAIDPAAVRRALAGQRTVLASYALLDTGEIALFTVDGGTGGTSEAGGFSEAGGASEAGGTGDPGGTHDADGLPGPDCTYGTHGTDGLPGPDGTRVAPLGPDGTRVPPLDDGGLRVTPLDIDGTAVLRFVEANLSSAGRVRAMAEAVPGRFHRVLDPLVAPLAALTRPGDTVLVCPAGALRAIPFHALRPDGTGALIDRNPVAYLPTVTSLRTLARRAPGPGGGTAVTGDPESAPPRAHGEPAAVGERPGRTRLPGGPADHQQVVGGPPGAAVVHAACRAAVDPADPLSAGLVLDGAVLTARDVLRQDWHGVRLAVLTGSGTGGTGRGDDLLGLSGALLHAGVRSLVTSLWPAPENTAAALLGDFQDLAAAGEAPARALRTAVLAARDLPGGDRLDTWAPFRLLGDWRAPGDPPTPDVPPTPGVPLAPYAPPAPGTPGT
ncbi:CHAT domain-containing protein [Streptomyces longispororuber]|uniref:CHAT domain-containing protein n=1 Tax=Streptomyces longispororuber TaxID=68230 RepID=UPI0033D70704